MTTAPKRLPMPFAPKRRWFAFGLLAVPMIAAGAFLAERVVRQSGMQQVERPQAERTVNILPLNTAKPGELRPILDSLERVTFGGELDDIDYRAIRLLVAKDDRLIDRNIRHIEVLHPDKIEVRTGPKEVKPLSGGGDIITMERHGDG